MISKQNKNLPHKQNILYLGQPRFCITNGLTDNFIWYNESIIYDYNSHANNIWENIESRWAFAQKLELKNIFKWKVHLTKSRDQSTRIPKQSVFSDPDKNQSNYFISALCQWAGDALVTVRWSLMKSFSWRTDSQKCIQFYQRKP